MPRCEMSWLFISQCAHCQGHELDFKIGRDGEPIG